jgi:hypothetical protein
MMTAPSDLILSTTTRSLVEIDGYPHPEHERQNCDLDYHDKCPRRTRAT